MMKRFMTLIGIILAATTFSAMAEESAGEMEYMKFCANCHGETGVGDGPIAGILTVDVPDVTLLAQANEGEFPFLETLMVIDGRTGVRGHGSNMPTWGDRYEREGLEVAGEYGAELIARGRLLALVEYIQSIQK